MANATKTKRTLLRSECAMPPREIRENTKARRAWLAEKLAEVNALPNREAKIVGTGSYQSVSVYEVKSVKGRLRLRGSCQFCGHSQVVDRKVLVLHGYKRPGDGMVYGRCPGVDLHPLNHDKSATEKWLAEAIADHETAKDALRTAETVKRVAFDALYDDSVDAELRLKANVAKPHKPGSHFNDKPSAEDIAAYREAYKTWATKYPLSSAHYEAERAYEAARQNEWMTRGNRDHFQALIDSKVYGTELTREVVA